jgi:4-carboxymuconolactone decarboxylase
MDALPDARLSPRELDEMRKAYVDLVGYVPPRIVARTDLLSRTDPEGLRLQEQLRKHFMYPACFDAKTVQLMLFGMLLMNLQDAAKIHATAARRAGATWDELGAVSSLAFLFRGLSAANVGAQMLQEIAAAEAAEVEKR